MASLKEGSQYEDVALVMALHTLVTATYDLRLSVKELVIALSYFSKDKEAYILQVKFLILNILSNALLITRISKIYVRFIQV